MGFRKDDRKPKKNSDKSFLSLLSLHTNEREGKDLSVVSVYGRFDSDRSVRTRDAGSNSYVSMSVVCI